MLNILLLGDLVAAKIQLLQRDCGEIVTMALHIWI
jgi:hypothetical protein